MSYIRNNLSKDEKITNYIELHFFYWVGVFIMFISIGLIPVGVYYLIQGLVLEQGITSKRVIVKRGWIARDIQEIRNNKIETVEYSQSIIGRLFGFGNVKITGAGRHNTVVISFVENPREIKNQIDEGII